MVAQPKGRYSRRLTVDPAGVGMADAQAVHDANMRLKYRCTHLWKKISKDQMPAN